MYWVGQVQFTLLCFVIYFIFKCKFVPYMSKKWISEIRKLQSKSFFHIQLAALEENLSSHSKNAFKD